MHMNHGCEPEKTIGIPLTTWESFEGNYFVGQTPVLRFCQDTTAWAGLLNPPCQCGGVPFNLSVVSITNLSGIPLLAQLWFNPSIQDPGREAEDVTPANTAMIPLPDPMISLRYDSDSRISEFTSGVNAFDRLVSPYSTTVVDKEGKFVFPSDGNFIVLLHPIKRTEHPINAIIALGWWEQDPYGME